MYTSKNWQNWRRVKFSPLYGSTRASERGTLTRSVRLRIHISQTQKAASHPVFQSLGVWISIESVQTFTSAKYVWSRQIEFHAGKTCAWQLLHTPDVILSDQWRKKLKLVYQLHAQRSKMHSNPLGPSQKNSFCWKLQRMRDMCEKTPFWGGVRGVGWVPSKKCSFWCNGPSRQPPKSVAFFSITKFYKSSTKMILFWCPKGIWGAFMLGPLHQNEHFFAGTAERILKWGEAENERWRRELVGGFWGHPPPDNFEI